MEQMHFVEEGNDLFFQLKFPRGLLMPELKIDQKEADGHFQIKVLR